MRVLILLSISIGVFTTGCVTSQDTNTSSIEEVETPDVDQSSKIVILNFDIIKSANAKSDVSLTTTEIIPGRLDKSVIIYPSRKLGKLIVHLLDDKQQIIEELVIKKPVLQIIDEYDRFGERELQNDEIEKNKFSVQFNKNSAIKSIKIFKFKDETTVEIFHEAVIQM
jgi:hypothetical protein